MSDVTASSDDGEDYVYGGGQLQEIKRYPIHDCCEFEDAENLRVSGMEKFQVVVAPKDDVVIFLGLV